MKKESLVIADQLCRGEYVLELCTHIKCARQFAEQDGEIPSLPRSSGSEVNG